MAFRRSKSWMASIGLHSRRINGTDSVYIKSKKRRHLRPAYRRMQKYWRRWTRRGACIVLDRLCFSHLRIIL
uniref:Putative ovule protein n=1 Tax=Solanum chacoense TaxID=4108 RepID=A0A0V0H7C0_SOLCH